MTSASTRRSSSITSGSRASQSSPKRHHRFHVATRTVVSTSSGGAAGSSTIGLSPATRWPRAMSPSHRALGFGVRSKVVRSHSHEAEPGPVPEGPLEVVEQRPVRVAAHVDAVVDAVEDALERGADVADALLVVVGADAVLGDDDRHLARR